MFGVGLHFSTDDLLAVKGIAVPGAIGQIVIATAIGAAVAATWGWSLGGGLVLGLALSVASTVVLLKALDERNALNSANGRIAVGWLIVEDLAMVLALVLLPALAGLLGGKAAVARSGRPRLIVAAHARDHARQAVHLRRHRAHHRPACRAVDFSQAARTGSHELFTLSVLAVALGIAYFSAKFFDVSFALGAFCAGIVLAKSELIHRAAEELLPLQNAFSVLFFVSVGCCSTRRSSSASPLLSSLVLLIILIGKSLVAFADRHRLWATRSQRQSSFRRVSRKSANFRLFWRRSAFRSACCPTEGKDLILAGALLSITLNPFAFALVKPVTDWINAFLGMLARGEPERRARLATLDRHLEDLRRKSEPAANLGLQPAQLLEQVSCVWRSERQPARRTPELIQATLCRTR